MRLQQPLDPKAVAQANKMLWGANPELEGRQLSMGPGDARYREQWVKAYLAAGGQPEPPAVQKPIDSPVQACPLAAPPELDCGKAWKELDDEAEGVLNQSSDPIERNNRINAAYAKMYLQDRRLHWLGAAAFASKQVGCGIREAQNAIDMAEAQQDAMQFGAEPDLITQLKGAYAYTVRDALAAGNRAVFKDVYPAHRFFEKYGIDKLRGCAGARQPPLDKKVLEGFGEIDAGHSASGATKILQHEQQDILQSRDVFGNEKIRSIMRRNQALSEWAIGRFLGAQKTSVSYNPDCSGEPAVTFEGENPADPDERWPYAQRVVGKFEELINDPPSNARLENDLQTIVERGK